MKFKTFEDNKEVAGTHGDDSDNWMTMQLSKCREKPDEWGVTFQMRIFMILRTADTLISLRIDSAELLNVYGTSTAEGTQLVLR